MVDVVTVAPVHLAPRRPVHRLAAACALVAVVLTGCSAPKVQKTPATSEPQTSTTGGDVESLYAQDVSWDACGDYECATIAAPLDWEDSTAGTIDLAIQRSVATGSADQRIGSLLINPGGPGASGIDFLDYAVTGVLGADVLADYDVVAFDPRGVAASSAVDCGDDATVDAFLTADVPIENQEELDAARANATTFGQGCLDATGDLLGHVDTVSAARDMDLIRAVLGDEKLYYAGFSYGTFLGATYAGLYPQNVGRMLLDGALDPSMSNDDLILGQAEGFENALRAYVEDCQAGADCPLTGTVDEGAAQIATLVDHIKARPIDALNGDVLNATMAFYGIVVTLYDDGSWSYLTQALTEAIQENTGSVLYQLADIYLDRNEDGTYSTNSMVAFTAINCLDYPMATRSYDEMVTFADQVAAVAPTFGRSFVMTVGCETWPFQSTVERAPITAPGAAPILVVGTTGDPATPYAWAQALADQLESGQLLTWQGEGHTAYGRSNSCVSDAVDTYLTTGTMPAEGLVC
ncbi:MAG: alpha/beta hydrolase [Cellulomonadaceae bacterium]|nr:alpha/beta hydrolase [Cellulomonadaceae bacterium]